MARTGKITLDGKIVVAECRIARDPISRFLGLMGKTKVVAGTGVLFPKCNSIHTFFMRMPIDVVFIDDKGVVKEVIDGLKAWRMLLPRSKVRHTLELGSGHAKNLGIKTGVVLRCEGVF